ncbi:MAG: argininosuccinate lyase [Gemmatimonadota bacterium]
MSALWGGRFAGGLDPAFDAFNRSLPFDRRLIQADIEGSIAWAGALGKAGVLTQKDVRALQRALRQLGRDLEADPSPLETSAAEDVHSFVEAALGERVGDLARRLHTGRSRNDQVATDLRLWLRERVAGLDGSLGRVMHALAELALRTAGTALPGYTHLQRAQPITAGHHALAYVEMLSRDRERLADAARRADACPLGSGALAGTAYRVDRKALAKALGFRQPTRNSLDAVSDRDFVLELAFVCSTIMVHLSRLSEDWIFFASHEAGFLKLGDSVSTGSSLMPQKKNPDALELIRGKAGRVIGHLQALLVTLKGLPLAYDKDLQEDKEALFGALDQTDACLRVMDVVVRSVQYDEARCEAAARGGFLNATDLADLLVRRGMPFRDAHEVVGRAVRAAIEHGCELEDLPAEVLAGLVPETGSVQRELSLGAVLRRRDVLGGTAPKRVKAEAEKWLWALEEDGTHSKPPPRPTRRRV